MWISACSTYPRGAHGLRCCRKHCCPHWGWRSLSDGGLGQRSPEHNSHGCKSLQRSKWCEQKSLCSLRADILYPFSGWWVIFPSSRSCPVLPSATRNPWPLLSDEGGTSVHSRGVGIRRFFRPFYDSMRGANVAYLEGKIHPAPLKHSLSPPNLPLPPPVFRVLTATSQRSISI